MNTKISNLKNKLSNKATQMKVLGTMAVMSAVSAGFCDTDINGAANKVASIFKNLCFWGGGIFLIYEIVKLGMAIKELGTDQGGPSNLKSHIFGIIGSIIVIGAGAVVNYLGLGSSVSILG